MTVRYESEWVSDNRRNMQLDLPIQLPGGVTVSLVLIGQIPAFHLKKADELVFQTTENVFLAAKPRVPQNIEGAETRPQGPLQHLPEELVFVLFLGPAQIPCGRTSLIVEGLFLGFADRGLLPHDDRRVHRQESPFSRQT